MSRRDDLSLQVALVRFSAFLEIVTQLSLPTVHLLLLETAFNPIVLFLLTPRAT